MLALRRATVSAVDGDWLQTDLGRAFNDPALHPLAQAGDEVVVNVQARLLGLGSGGYDVVVANLTRGLEAAVGERDPHVMKLNYAPVQHGVEPIDGPRGAVAPVAVLALHGQLEPLAWAFSQARPGASLGYVQTGGGALPGALSDTVKRLRANGLLAAHVTAGPAYGGEEEAISVAGAIAALAARCDVVVAGPGPGILGSATELGHGGLAALDTAHAALALGSPTLLVARMSDADPRERHRGLSHHTRTVLELLLVPVVVAMPASDPVLRMWAQCADPTPGLRRHEVRTSPVDLAAYPGPTTSMGREDPLFVASALAAGGVLADLR